MLGCIKDFFIASSTKWKSAAISKLTIAIVFALRLYILYRHLFLTLRHFNEINVLVFNAIHYSMKTGVKRYRQNRAVQNQKRKVQKNGWKKQKKNRNGKVTKSEVNIWRILIVFKGKVTSYKHLEGATRPSPLWAN